MELFFTGTRFSRRRQAIHPGSTRNLDFERFLDSSAGTPSHIITSRGSQCPKNATFHATTPEIPVCGNFAPEGRSPPGPAKPSPRSRSNSPDFPDLDLEFFSPIFPRGNFPPGLAFCQAAGAWPGCPRGGPWSRPVSAGWCPLSVGGPPVAEVRGTAASPGGGPNDIGAHAEGPRGELGNPPKPAKPLNLGFWCGCLGATAQMDSPPKGLLSSSLPHTGPCCGWGVGGGMTAPPQPPPGHRGPLLPGSVVHSALVWGSASLTLWGLGCLRPPSSCCWQSPSPWASPPHTANSVPSEIVLTLGVRRP